MAAAVLHWWRQACLSAAAHLATIAFAICAIPHRTTTMAAIAIVRIRLVARGGALVLLPSTERPEDAGLARAAGAPVRCSAADPTAFAAERQPRAQRRAECWFCSKAEAGSSLPLTASLVRSLAENLQAPMPVSGDESGDRRAHTFTVSGLAVCRKEGPLPSSAGACSQIAGPPAARNRAAMTSSKRRSASAARGFTARS